MILAVLLLALVAACTGQDNSDVTVSSVENSSSGSAISNSGDNVGDSGVTVYLPTNAVLNQFLNATGMEPDSLVAVSSSYGVLQTETEGLAAITTPDTNVFASVLIVPDITDTSLMDMMNQSEPNLHGGLSSRTQLMYNCTSSPALWNMIEDANVLNLASLQLFDNNTNVDKVLNFLDGSTNTTEQDREIAAVITIEVLNCSAIQNSSIGRPILGNAFFGSAFDSSPSYFYSLSSTELWVNDSTTDTARCLLQIEMARASLTEVYPNCKIKFHSTDLNSLVATVPADSSMSGLQPKRRLAFSSFGFVKDPSCTYRCGSSGAAVDQCLKSDGKGGWITVQCKMQFYEMHSDCDFECGDKTGSPYNLIAPSASQCYDCYKTTSSCKSGYYIVSGVGCCQTLNCVAMDSTQLAAPPLLTWNLGADGRTIINPDFTIFNNGYCSDSTNPSSNCCRITCSNCFLNISVLSFAADLDAYSSPKEYSTTTELQLAGTSEMKLKLFAPNGCAVETIDNIATISLSSSLGTGMTIETKLTLDILKKLNMQRHRSIIEFGSTNEIRSLSTGSVHSDQKFFGIQVASTASQDLAPTGIGIDLEVDVIPTVTASINFFTAIAKIGVKTKFSLFTQLQSSISFPDSFAKLSTKYLNDASTFHGGDCRLPHFMEYTGFAGYKDITVTLPTSLNVPDVATKDSESVLLTSSDRISTSLVSGCISSIYNTGIRLFTTLDGATLLSDKKQTALKNILTSALGIPEVDPAFVTVVSISTVTGEISVQISIPPSLSVVYPNASSLETLLYTNARTSSFATVVSSYVGLDFASRCDSGWRGTSCTDVCSSLLFHCATRSSVCNSISGAVLSCDSCASGWWGFLCQTQCVSEHCSAGFVNCNVVTGVAISCNSCNVGWWSWPLCQNQCLSPHCPTGSVSCDSANGTAISCSSCNDGWWGLTCENQCSSAHCPSGSVSCDAVSGMPNSCSTCNSGWWGSTCRNQCASTHCAVGSVSCDSKSGSVISCSSCDGGWWGSTCQNQCSSTHCPTGSVSCDYATGKIISCSTCDDGWWGKMCENQCSSLHCPIDSVSCESINGTASSCSSCDNGWWGTMCETQCALEHCPVDSVSCNAVDGSVNSCSQCNDGWWGATCEMQCSSDHCPAGSVSCDASSGNATSCKLCDDGWWGNLCEYPCSSAHCSVDSTLCDSVSGETTFCGSCEETWWGTTCEKPCTSSHCVDGSVHCGHTSGITTSCDDCGDGWWGSTCETQCSSPHCPLGSVSCEAGDGTVASCSQCSDGWWGTACESQCSSEHCPVGSVSCDHASGVATSCSECEDGYWGSLCENEIATPSHCVKARSPQDDGLSSWCLSCEHGYWGARCEHLCNVPLRCKTSRCAQDSGKVSMCLRCNYGWHGRLCASKLGRAWM